MGPATRNALLAARLARVVSSTSLDLGLEHAAPYLAFTNTGEKTCTVLPQTTVAWGDAAEIVLRNAATAGNLTIVAGSGVTIVPPADGSLVLAPNMTAMLYRVSEDVWHLFGRVLLS